jgi:hypothetical protein
MEQYLPSASIDYETILQNKSLPGEGGMFFPLNLSAYHFSFNNPLTCSDPTGGVGHKETAPSNFPVLYYLELFETAGYRERGMPTLHNSLGNQQPRAFKSDVKVGPLELLGRIFPVGITEIDKKNMLAKRAEFASQLLSNILDPDVPVAISAWIQTDNSARKILNWSLSIMIFDIDTTIETAGSRPGHWVPRTIDSKDIALRILMANPDLMYRLLIQTEILDD